MQSHQIGLVDLPALVLSKVYRVLPLQKKSFGILPKTLSGKQEQRGAT
jgi:hypothetical protein